MKGLTTGVRASLLHPVAATTAATGNLRNTRFPIDQSQSVSHVVSQNTLARFRISQLPIAIKGRSWSRSRLGPKTKCLGLVSVSWAKVSFTSLPCCCTEF